MQSARAAENATVLYFTRKFFDHWFLVWNVWTRDSHSWIQEMSRKQTLKEKFKQTSDGKSFFLHKVVVMNVYIKTVRHVKTRQFNIAICKRIQINESFNVFDAFWVRSASGGTPWTENKRIGSELRKNDRLYPCWINVHGGIVQTINVGKERLARLSVIVYTS